MENYAVEIALYIRKYHTKFYEDILIKFEEIQILLNLTDLPASALLMHVFPDNFVLDKAISIKI